VVTNGLEIAYLEAGEGDPVLLFHGFPDSASTFCPLMELLCAEGYRCIAPWLRGYSPTSASAYFDQGTLLADALALVESLELHGVRVVGHDWGADIAYGLASTVYAEVRSAVALAVPHTQALRRNRAGNFEQLRRSFYIWLFLAGELADSIVPADDFEFIRDLWRAWSPGWQADEAHLREVIDGLKEPDGLRSALAYYRALHDDRLQDQRRHNLRWLVENGPVRVPTLLLMGSGDGCIGPEMAAGAESAFSGAYRAETLEGCGHFLHLEKPQEVGALVIDWFASY